jgi:hypothetical protein
MHLAGANLYLVDLLCRNNDALKQKAYKGVVVIHGAAFRNVVLGDESFCRPSRP